MCISSLLFLKGDSTIFFFFLSDGLGLLLLFPEENIVEEEDDDDDDDEEEDDEDDEVEKLVYNFAVDDVGLSETTRERNSYGDILMSFTL